MPNNYKYVDVGKPEYPLKDGYFYADFDAGAEFKQVMSRIAPGLLNLRVVSTRKGANRSEALLECSFIEERSSNHCFFVFVCPLEGGGRSYEHEQRIQFRPGSQWTPDLSTIKAASNFVDYSEQSLVGKECYCIGIYKPYSHEDSEEIIFAGVYPQAITPFEGLNTSNGSIQIDIRNIRDAYIKGVSIQAKDRKKRIICFKPHYIFWYMINRDDLHLGDLEKANAVVEEVLKSRSALPSRIHIDNMPLQQVYYGAPGAGKSYRVNEKTKGCSVIRTTFHPDSDYSSFVGSYKPVVLESSKGLQSSITYCFVKQAFLKAYLKAWKLFVAPASSATVVTSFVINGALYTISSINHAQLTYIKDLEISKNMVRNVWGLLWDNGKFSIPKGPQSGRSIEQAISFIIVSHCLGDNAAESDFEKGWDLLLEELNEGEVETQTGPSGKKYTLSRGSHQGVIHVRTIASNSKQRLALCFDAEDEANGVEKGIIRVLSSFKVESFDEAWEKLTAIVIGSKLLGSPSNELFIATPVYLVIEEINRGNCAQIFGDIFQLLDRQENGFSAYPIEADSELQKAIAKAFSEEEEYKLSCAIDVDYAIDSYTSVFGSSLSKDVEEGRVLLLPPNLHILATMNTSDQSLFPMDSAFKRRWSWKYVPIDMTDKKSSRFLIKIGERHYRWIEFLKVVNMRIYDTTQSEDKQMGNFFIKDSVLEDEFKNKVMFYIWSEICKEEAGTERNFFRDAENNEFTFNQLYESMGKELLWGFMEQLGISYTVESSAENKVEEV